MSKYHFLRKFKQLTGVTVHTYVMNKRLLLACSLLSQGESMNAVCRKTGFGPREKVSEQLISPR